MYVVWRYSEAGLLLGDYMIYMFVPKDIEISYNKWKIRYMKLGYEPLLKQQWANAVGFGEPYTHLLRQPKRG